MPSSGWRWPALLIAVAAFSSAAGTKLTILSPHWEGPKREFEEAFRQAYEKSTGRQAVVEWLDVGASSNLMVYLRSEFQRRPQGVGIDLVWGGGAIYYSTLAAEGLLAPAGLSAEDLAGIPRELAGHPLYDAEGRWFGAALSSFGILCNPRVRERMKLPRPSRWADLADPAFFSWVALADPRDSGTAHMMLELIFQSYGWEKGLEVITRLGANARSLPRAASQIPVLVATGEVACGPCIDFYAWAKMAEVGPGRLEFILPAAETVVNTDPIAMLKGAPEPDLARAFIRFVLSPAGQRLWMLPAGADRGPRRWTLGRLSVRPELYAELAGEMVMTYNPFQAAPGLHFNSELAQARWQTLNDLFGALIADPHPALVSAWVGAKNLGESSPAWRRLAAAPEDEVTFLGRTAQWKDPEQRARVIAEWLDFAAAKYHSVRRMTGNAPRPGRENLARGVRYLIPAFMLGMLVYLPVRRLRRWRRRGRPGRKHGFDRDCV